MAPRWVVRLLGVLVAPEDQDEVIGDLEELHRRRVHRWGGTAATVATAVEGSGLLLRHLAAFVLRAAAARGHGVSAVEVRLALRLVRRQPVMTLTAVVALGLGIGMVAGGFSVFQQALYGELPFPDGDRWISVETYSAETGRRASLDLGRLRAFRASAPALAYLGGSESEYFNLRLPNGEVERVAGARVTPGLFERLPYVPSLGRLLVVGDGALGAPPVALIRASLWSRRFSGDPSVVGRSLEVAGAAYTIVGVLPDDAGFPAEGDVWIPIPEATLGATDDRAPVGSRHVAVLAPGATVEQARDQLQQISQRASTPGSGAESLRHRVGPLARPFLGPQVQVGVAVFMTVLVLVLLVIAGNVANLVVARTSRRSAELAVRTALGASRTRIISQLFVEVLVIGGLASLLGLAAAGGILAVYDRVLDELPFWIDLHLDPATALVTVLLALLSSAVIGVLPALRATRGSPGDALRGAGRGASMSVGPFGRLMIASEVALSVALIGIAVLFAQGFQMYVTPAFRLPEDRVITARLYVDPEAAGADPDSGALVLRRLEQSVAALPGVVAVSAASHLPRVSPSAEAVELEGVPTLVSTPVVGSGPGLFAVLEVEPILGRGLEQGDMGPDAAAVVVVNRAFAQRNFGTDQVLGRRLRIAEASDEGTPSPWREIVGVVPDVMEVTGSTRAAGIYVPLTPRQTLSLAVRVESDPLTFAGPLRRAAYDVDPRLNISEIVRLDDVGAENRTALAVMSSGLLAIGVITLLLSLAGVYSIVSLTVTQRTREIGIRVALGATPLSVLWSVLRSLGALVVFGALVGAAAGWQGSGVKLFVFAVPRGQWWLFAGLVALMGLAGLLACLVPARRALAIQPVEALQADS